MPAFDSISIMLHAAFVLTCFRHWELEERGVKLLLGEEENREGIISRVLLLQR